MRALLIALIALFGFSVYATEADSLRYASRHFRAIGDALALTQKPAPDSVVTFNNVPLVFEYDIDGSIKHIGYKLFHRDKLGSPLADVLRYVERIALERDLPLNATDISEASSLDLPLIREDFPYRLNDMANSVDMDLSVNEKDDKQLSVVWRDSDGKGVSVIFPINHNRILGYALDELSDRFARNVVDFPEELIPDDKVPGILVAAEPFDFLQTSPLSYLLDSLTNARYYEEYKGEYYILQDISYPVHVLANLLTGNDIYSTNVIDLYIEGMRTTLQAPLHTLVGYFRAEGCTPYFGISSYQGSEIKGVAVYVNPLLGYCHVLKIKCDDRMLIQFDGLCEGRLVPYVPISKINSLFEN